jgi:hypothetical protein
LWINLQGEKKKISGKRDIISENIYYIQKMDQLPQNELFALVISAGLPVVDFALMGSAMMYVKGLRSGIKDIDIIARDSAWEKAKELGAVQVPASGTGEWISLFDGKVNIYNKWAPGEWDTDMLIDSAEEIGGLRFVTLENVRAWKKIYNREKDLADIELIDKYLQSNKV